ncbi:UDP-galactose transporter senju-like [Ruditapes philippinarum]|uniref:UDP-galactose transporter senju-like n=1 Tax=Ruditapes philippinarum TaxID=129788 RepID=UPI00295AA78E|nr:UDP-galactose transporter senju-like [Ruditapes philippinarum]
MAWCSKDLFPTKMSFVYFISYMGLFINQGILVTASKSKNNTYSYNTVTVVLLTECIKLVAAILIYLKEKSPSSFVSDFVNNKETLLYYFVPAGLYCLYNNLQFENLANYDPTTYYLLLQFRVVVTGVVFQIVFQKQLSRIQWVSLVFLTFGCIVKEYGRLTGSGTAADATKETSFLNLHLFLILVQVFCSCFAGVYNEYLLKGRGVDIHIMMQNVFMYLDSIVCNGLILAYKGQLTDAFTASSLSSIFQINVICIMLNNAAIGIVVSLFLRSLNSILKTFASALELMFTAVLCWFLFGITIDVYTIIAIVIVSAATFLYAHNPVVNVPKDETQDKEKANGKSETV